MTRCTRALRWPIFCLIFLLPARLAFAEIQETGWCSVYIEIDKISVECVMPYPLLGLSLDSDAGGIRADQQRTRAAEASERLSEIFELRADGQLLSYEFEQIGFATKDQSNGDATADQRELIPFHEISISGIFVCPRDTLPRSVDFRLKLFEGQTDSSTEIIPVEIEVRTSPTRRESARFELTAERPEFSWVLPQSIAGLSFVDKIAAAPPRSYAPLYVAGFIMMSGLGICVIPSWKGRARLATGAVVLAAGVVLGAISLRNGFTTPIEEDQAKSTIRALLTNVYYAFASRDESNIFDTLAASVDGTLLEELYLDIQSGLIDTENGGPRVRVLSVEVVECQVEESNSERLQARVRWVSIGTVNHWGHAHERRNQYQAEVVAEPVDGHWRLTNVTILEEERIE
ncbi:MAG: hypothetical protein AAGB34_05075 [Planctomycetota bacterium]